MSTPKQVGEKAHQKHAWIILFALGIFLSLNGTFIIAFVNEDSVSSEIADYTGVPVDELPPSIIDAFIVFEMLNGAGFLAASLFGTAVAFFSYRKAERWAWYAMWIFPLLLGFEAATFFLYDLGSIGTYYSVLVTFAMLGLLLPLPRFFPGQSK